MRNCKCRRNCRPLPKPCIRPLPGIVANGSCNSNCKKPQPKCCPGPRGPQGPQGPIGPTGPQGPAGVLDPAVLQQLNTITADVLQLMKLQQGLINEAITAGVLPAGTTTANITDAQLRTLAAFVAASHPYI